MPLVKHIRNVFFSSGDDQPHAYQCNVCQASFTADAQTAADAGCPHCGANNVRERLEA